jgi:hypothetical protein
MENALKSMILTSVFRNRSAVVVKFRVEWLSDVGVWLVNISSNIWWSTSGAEKRVREGTIL